MSDQKLGADNWLHIITHAISNYSEEGGAVVVEEVNGEVRVWFTGVGRKDGRLHPRFCQLSRPVSVEEAS